MTEKDLNIKYICEKTLLDKQDELIPIILEMINESYKSGLNQAEYDNTMGLVEENVKLSKEVDRWFVKYNDECDKNEYLVNDNKKLQQENAELKKRLEEVELIVGLRQKRNLICKFDKEYDKEDKKNNPNRDYAGVVPDAEEVYKRYYNMKNQQEEFIKYLEVEKDRLTRELSNIYEDGVGKTKLVNEDIFNEINKVLSKYKEIIGGVEDGI